MKRALLITLFVVITASFAAVCPLCAQDTAAWADFQQKAAAWRALPVKPALSDDLKRERLLAENAVSEKRFQDAVSHYEAGLKLNPMWPEGHFNAALVSAELTNYDKAVWHMRAYVELAPNAPDSEESRNQIIIWQDKQFRVQRDEMASASVDPETKLGILVRGASSFTSAKLHTSGVVIQSVRSGSFADCRDLSLVWSLHASISNPPEPRSSSMQW